MVQCMSSCLNTKIAECASDSVYLALLISFHRPQTQRLKIKSVKHKCISSPRWFKNVNRFSGFCSLLIYFISIFVTHLIDLSPNEPQVTKSFIRQLGRLVHNPLVAANVSSKRSYLSDFLVSNQNTGDNFR